MFREKKDTRILLGKNEGYFIHVYSKLTEISVKIRDKEP